MLSQPVQERIFERNRAGSCESSYRYPEMSKENGALCTGRQIRFGKPESGYRFPDKPVATQPRTAFMEGIDEVPERALMSEFIRSLK